MNESETDRIRDARSATITGEVLDETTEITVTELCKACDVESALVEQLIAEGILDPIAESTGKSAATTGELRFHFTSVRRTRTVLHLQNDLGVNLAGAALAIELLDRIEHLRRQQ